MSAHAATLENGPPPAHAGQNRILDLRARYKIAVCGRRFGKTVAAAIAAIKLCRNPKLPNQRVWWISPIQEQSDRVERQMVGWLFREIKGYKKRDNNEAEPVINWEHRRQEHALINLETRSRIEFHSAHVPDRLRGAGLDLVIVDEAADISEYTWKMVLKPMLLESRGKAIITGTPRGKQHWLHRVFLLGQQPEHADMYASLQLPTTENRLLDKNEIESFRAEMTPGEFRQEFEAEFIDGVDSVFTNLDACTGGELLQRGRAGNWQINLPQSGGKTVTLHPADAAKELAARKPHWVKAKVFGGSGAGGNNAAANAAGITYAELLKPHNQDKLRDYVHDKPEELERLRQAHFRK